MSEAKTHTTYKYRIKDSANRSDLQRKAKSVNAVWNFCNETSWESARRGNRWITEFDLNCLLNGISKDLGLNALTIRSISRQFANKRKQARRPKLQWRSSKRSLGWIPFTKMSISPTVNGFKYFGQEYKCWMSRPIEGEIKCGSFNQDASGKWFINITCEIPVKATKATSSIGIDLGLKTLATCSDGTQIENPRQIKSLEQKLATSQRAKHKKQTRNIHKKIANKRKDHLHKESSKLVKQHKQIFIGDVSSSKLTKTRMAKSVNDAGWAMFKTMLLYKAIRLGVECEVINEKYSSVTCSVCLKRTGPSGLGALGVRHWECECGASHDRDINAAQNILRVGRGCATPLGELSL